MTQQADYDLLERAMLACLRAGFDGPRAVARAREAVVCLRAEQIEDRRRRQAEGLPVDDPNRLSADCAAAAARAERLDAARLRWVQRLREIAGYDTRNGASRAALALADEMEQTI